MSTIFRKICQKSEFAVLLTANREVFLLLHKIFLAYFLNHKGWLHKTPNVPKNASAHCTLSPHEHSGPPLFSRVHICLQRSWV